MARRAVRVAALGSAARLTNPIVARWRSARAPIWNHRIERPILLWDNEVGVAEDALDAVRDGRAEAVRPPAPTPTEFDARVADELAVSLGALRDRTLDYEDRRWRPGKLEPVADALWRAGAGYLDVLAAVHR